MTNSIIIMLICLPMIGRKPLISQWINDVISVFDENSLPRQKSSLSLYNNCCIVIPTERCGVFYPKRRFLRLVGQNETIQNKKISRKAQSFARLHLKIVVLLRHANALQV